MKPKPFSALKNFTIPVANVFVFSQLRARAQSLAPNYLRGFATEPTHPSVERTGGDVGRRAQGRSPSASVPLLGGTTGGTKRSDGASPGDTDGEQIITDRRPEA